MNFIFTVTHPLEAKGIKKFFPQKSIIITGIGKENVFKTMEKLKNKPELIIHTGFAGSLGKLKIFDVFICKRVMFHNSTIDLECEFFLNPTLKKASILTIQKPLMIENLRDELFLTTNADAVDLESFFFVKLAKERGIKLEIIKIISDMADKNAKMEIKKNGKLLSIELGRKLWEVIHK